MPAENYIPWLEREETCTVQILVMGSSLFRVELYVVLWTSKGILYFYIDTLLLLLKEEKRKKDILREFWIKIYEIFI